MSREAREELDLQPYDWVSSDADGGFSTRVWCHTKDGINVLNPDPKGFAQQVLLRIEDYEPFCRLELPTTVEGRPVKWTFPALKVYAQWLKSVLGTHAPTKIQYKEMEKLYHFSNHTKYPFLVCYFSTEEAMKHCVNLIGKQGYAIEQLGFIKSRVWETSISTIHRLVTDISVGYGQWFRVNAEKVPDLDKVSYCEHEYKASFKDLRALPEETTKGWTVSPLIAALDIECYSHNHRAMPNRDYVNDVVFQVSFILQRMNHPETREKTLLVVGPCGEIPGANVIHFEHEIPLIEGLCDLIMKSNPAILLGYNIFGFDFPYLDARLKLYLRDWRPCGLMKDQPTFVNSRVWKSSAYGYMTIAPLEAEGRICIDMYPIIKRDHKLDRYTLDHVSKHFLNRGKHDVTAKQMFEIYAECKAAEEDGTIERIEKAKQEMAVVGAYCLEDSCLCIDLLQKLNTWIMLIELATIVCVKVLHIFTQGQQLRVQNEVYQYAYREDYVIDERPGSRDGFKGGHVQDPIPGRYRNILIFDFASLYPSIIRAFNICYTTLVSPESSIPDEMCHILAWSELDDNKKSPTFGQTKHYRYRFIKQEYYHGILPRMCDHLVEARNATRKLINPKNDPIYNNILNQRQLGLKVTANSIFGALGVTEGRLPLPEGARSITAMGRVLIGMAAEHVRTKHEGMIVYGDTDSIMVDMGITDPNECIRIGEMLSKEITAIYPRPLSLEFERALAIGFFIKKKKYAGVPLAMIKLIGGDLIEKVSFDPEYEDPDLDLYKFVIFRNDKRSTKYVAVPKFVQITPVPLDLEAKIEIVWPEVLNPETGKKEQIGDPIYRVTQRGETIETTGRRAIAGTPLNAGGKPNVEELMKKGIILARRDNCIWAREAYQRVLLSIMFGKPLDYTLNIVDEEIMKMMTRQVPFQKLLVTRAIGSNYKPNSTYPLKLFSDELRKQGHIVQAGDRIDYIFVRNQDPERDAKQAYKMRLTEMYWANCDLEPIDRIYYVEKAFKNPVDQILYLGYKDQIDTIEAKCKPPIKRRKRIYTYIQHNHINTWVKLLKAKEDLVNYIKYVKPHFTSHDPAFTYSFYDQPPPPTFEIVG